MNWIELIDFTKECEKHFGLISCLGLSVLVDWLYTSLFYPHGLERFLGSMMILEKTFVDPF